MLRGELVGFKIVFSQNGASTCTNEYCRDHIRKVRELSAYMTINNVRIDICFYPIAIPTQALLKHPFTLNSLPNDKIFGLSKLKAFAVDKIKVTENLIFFCEG